MDIDFVREAELDSMIALMSEAFEMDYTAARRVFLADPYLDFQNKRVLRVEGRVVSCLSLIPTECWIGEAQVSFAGIAGVATRPKERRKGYAGLLLADGVRLLQERGFAVAGLIPYDIAFYRKFGWEVGSTTYQLRTLPNHLPLFPERRAVRMASAADTPALDALYTTFAQNRTLHCPRNETRWRYLLAMVKQSVVYANTSGEVEGYLFYEHRKQVVGEEKTTLRILEMHSTTAEARRGLTGFLAMQNVNAIDFEGSWEALGRSGLLATEAETEGISAQIEVATGAMIRVINFVQLAQALSVHWEGFAGEIYLAVSDGWVENGVSAVRVAGRGGFPTVDEVEAERVMASPHRLIADVRRWSQVMVGYLSGDDACASGWLQASTPEAALCAGELFPARQPFLPLADHF